MDKKTRLKIGLPTIVFFTALIFTSEGYASLLPFAAAFAHELGHIAVMVICGQKIERITLLPFGIDIKKRPSVTSYTTDIAVNTAGLAVNALLILLCLQFPESRLQNSFIEANAFLFAVNALPIKNLDGGQVLEKTLCLKLDSDTAEAIMDFCSLVCLIAVGSVAIWLLLSSGYNFTLLFMCIYLFFGIFIKKDF